MRALVWLGMLLFTTKLGSRRRIRFKFHTPGFIDNLNRLAQTRLNAAAHPSTLGELMDALDPEGLAGAVVHVARRLLRSRCLERWRLLDRYYLVAFDATRIGHWRHRHCEHCLKQTIKGKDAHGRPVAKTLYYHMVLEAKLVTSSGLAFSLATEFVENPGPDPDVQDCELKAFYRLAPRVKAAFPHLPICVLLDANYAGEPVLKLCEQLHWQYIIVLKQGAMPAVFEEFQTLKAQTPKQTRCIQHQGAQQRYHWVNDIAYHDHPLHVLECVETRGETTRRWTWLISFRLNARNAPHVANTGGRQRWKIENQGFNAQKNGGYNLEHAYSQDPQGMKNFYFLLQLGHVLAQLLEHGSLIRPLLQKHYGSLRNFTEELLEHLRHRGTTEAQYQALLATAYQIRLDSS